MCAIYDQCVPFNVKTFWVSLALSDMLKYFFAYSKTTCGLYIRI